MAVAAGVDGGPQCASVLNVDYGKGTNWMSKNCAGHGSKDANAACCCKACTAQEGCVAGLLYNKVCYFKNATMVNEPSDPSRVLTVTTCNAMLHNLPPESTESPHTF
jgi:hypothetical protein